LRPAGFAHQSLQRLPRRGDGFAAEPRLPTVLYFGEPFATLVLDTTTPRRQRGHLPPAAIRGRPAEGEPSLGEDAHRHADAFLGHAGQAGQVTDPYPVLIKDAQHIGADREGHR